MRNPYFEDPTMPGKSRKADPWAKETKKCSNCFVFLCWTNMFLNLCNGHFKHAKVEFMNPYLTKLWHRKLTTWCHAGFPMDQNAWFGSWCFPFCFFTWVSHNPDTIHQTWKGQRQWDKMLPTSSLENLQNAVVCQKTLSQHLFLRFWSFVLVRFSFLPTAASPNSCFTHSIWQTINNKGNTLYIYANMCMIVVYVHIYILSMKLL